MRMKRSALSSSSFSARAAPLRLRSAATSGVGIDARRCFTPCARGWSRAVRSASKSEASSEANESAIPALSYPKRARSQNATPPARSLSRIRLSCASLVLPASPRSRSRRWARRDALAAAAHRGTPDDASPSSAPAGAPRRRVDAPRRRRVRSPAGEPTRRAKIALSKPRTHTASARGAWRVYEQIPRRPDRPANYDAYRYPVPAGLPGGHFVVSGYDSDCPDDSQRRGRTLRAVGHGGVDLPDPRGTPVSLVALDNQVGDADVVYAGPLFGTTVVTRHTVREAAGLRDYVLLFGHLDSIAPGVGPGRTVKEGRRDRRGGRHRLAGARTPSPRGAPRARRARHRRAREGARRERHPRRRRDGRFAIRGTSSLFVEDGPKYGAPNRKPDEGVVCRARQTTKLPFSRPRDALWTAPRGPVDPQHPHFPEARGLVCARSARSLRPPGPRAIIERSSACLCPPHGRVRRTCLRRSPAERRRTPPARCRRSKIR